MGVQENPIVIDCIVLLDILLRKNMDDKEIACSSETQLRTIIGNMTRRNA